MSNIELPAYKMIVSNEVYGRKAESFKHPIIGELQTTQIIKLARFKIPTEDDVIDFIRTTAKGIDFYSLGKQKSSNNEPKASYFLKLLPLSEVKDIARDNKNSLRHLRDHYSDNNLQPGRNYVGATSGIIPNQILDSAKRLFPKEGSVVYERAIERIGAREWNLRIRLEENGRFPDSSELEYLLDRGVRECNIFIASGDFYNYDSIAEQVRLLYNSLSSSEIISRIGDSSYKFLEQQAASTIESAAQCIATRGAVGALAGIVGQVLMGQILGENSEQQNLPKKPFGFGDCSLN